MAVAHGNSLIVGHPISPDRSMPIFQVVGDVLPSAPCSTSDRHTNYQEIVWPQSSTPIVSLDKKETYTIESLPASLCAALKRLARHSRFFSLQAETRFGAWIFWVPREVPQEALNCSLEAGRRARASLCLQLQSAAPALLHTPVVSRRLSHLIERLPKPRRPGKDQKMTKIEFSIHLLGTKILKSAQATINLPAEIHEALDCVVKAHKRSFN